MVAAINLVYILRATGVGGAVTITYWLWRITKNRKIGSIRDKLWSLGIVQPQAVQEWLRGWMSAPDGTPDWEIARNLALNEQTRAEIEKALTALVQESNPPAGSDLLSTCLKPIYAIIRAFFPFSVTSQDREVLEMYAAVITSRLDRCKPSRRAGQTVAAGKHDIRLEKLLQMTPWGEVWRGISTERDEWGVHTAAAAGPVVFRTVQFYTEPAARERISRNIDDLNRSLPQLREVESIAHFEHLGMDAETPFLVSEFLPGGTLKAWLMESEDKRLPLDKAETINRLISGLAAAHELKIFHRRLDPSKILLAVRHEPGKEHPAVKVKIADFGVSFLTQKDADPMYVPPEADQHDERNKEERTAQNDIFSLGVIWYQLLIDDEELERPPYDFYTRLSDHDKETRDRLEKCLAHPDSRWKNACALRQGMTTVASEPAAPAIKELSAPINGYDVSDLLRDYLMTMAQPAA